MFPFAFAPGPLEIIIVLVIVLLLFGAKRLPELGKSLGSGMREFKTSVTGKDRHDDEPEQIEQPDRTPDATTPAPAATTPAPTAEERAATEGAGTAEPTRS
jgi:sec-independent protein translocase protein TatA